MVGMINGGSHEGASKRPLPNVDQFAHELFPERRSCRITSLRAAIAAIGKPTYGYR
jgi:hypothetical protein